MPRTSAGGITDRAPIASRRVGGGLTRTRPGDVNPGPRPHWPIGPDGENATPRPDPRRPRVPYALTEPARFAAAHGGCRIEPHVEYTPTAGVLVRYQEDEWSEIVADLVANLTGDPAHDEIAYVVVADASQRQHAQWQFANAGADLSKVRFIVQPNDSIWMRDYGPQFIWQGGAGATVDSTYYPNRPLDNFMPTELADTVFEQPSYHLDLKHPGGNLLAATNGHGFITSLVLDQNRGLDESRIAELFRQYHGIDTLHILPRLPMTVDHTGHIDMWLYLVDEDTVIIGEFLPGSDPDAIEITNNAVPYMESLGYEVFRVPAWDAVHPGWGSTHYTYTNGFRVNDRIFIPSYGAGRSAYIQHDDDALATWRQAAGSDVEIVPINAWDIVSSSGVLHCITKQVPLYPDALPSACVTSPGPGALLVAGTTHEITWAASDDGTVETVDLYYAIDGGPDQVIATGLPNDRVHTWTVPDVETTSARVTMVARDDHGNVVEAEGGPVRIVSAAQHVYDFGTGAGVDRWGWAWENLAFSWDEIDGVRHPTLETGEPTLGAIEGLTFGAYHRMSTSDATGGAEDTRRYFSSAATFGHSIHVFEFVVAEDPAAMLDLTVRWEGFAKDCAQVELYVWDNVARQWCDGRGHCGQSRHMDNFGGNRDEDLEGHIREQFDRYLDDDGILAVMVTGDYVGDPVYHDYLSVTVTYDPNPCLGDLDRSGAVDFADLTSLLAGWGPCLPSTSCASDLDGDEAIGFGDLTVLLANWGGCA